MRAVYYCRVSTEEESQVNALAGQIQEAKDCIESKGWLEVDSYIDEGKSGTQTKSRSEYNRLFDDLDTNRFDVIVIKSQDRLMRNTKDWYIFIDKLVTNNKKLYFYLDNKFYTPDDALITGIKAILAEDYSRELSKKINNAHRSRQKTCNSVVITNATWGYDKLKNGDIVINEKEAKIVRLIYDLCIEGYGARTTSKELSNRGIKSRTGGNFPEVTIRRIVRNPLFKGTAVMNRRRKDFETGKTIHVPEEEWIHHEDAVPAIVSKEIWQEANKAMDSRARVVDTDSLKKRRTGKNKGKYNLSSKIICGECGSVYWRRYRQTKKSGQVVDWSCSEYISRGRRKIKDPRGKDKLRVKVKNSGCDNIHIKEEDINNILLEVSKKIFNNSSDLIENLINILRTTMSDDDIEKENKHIKAETNKVISQKNMLLDKLLDEVITNEDYKRKDIELEKKLSTLKKREEVISERLDEAQSIEERIANIRDYLKTDGSDKTKIEKLIRHIEEIIIYPDRLEVHLDMYKKTIVGIEKVGNKYQYVDTSKYLIPHTDTYRYKGKHREVTVTVCT